VDKLATKVIEVGGGEAPLYPGGYEDFLYWKRQRESPHLALPPPSERRREDMDDGTASVATKAAPPSAAPRVAPAPTPSPNPLAPRLRQSGAPPERQALERDLKRARTRLADLETRVSQTEQAVKALEARMTEPGFYDDRERAAQATEEHQKLMWETGDLMAQWEALQAEVDEKARSLAAVTPAPRR
jgi:ATP-binding cassette subfamily F protein 3